MGKAEGPYRACAVHLYCPTEVGERRSVAGADSLHDETCPVVRIGPSARLGELDLGRAEGGGWWLVIENLFAVKQLHQFRGRPIRHPPETGNNLAGAGKKEALNQADQTLAADLSP